MLEVTQEGQAAALKAARARNGAELASPTAEPGGDEAAGRNVSERPAEPADDDDGDDDGDDAAKAARGRIAYGHPLGESRVPGAGGQSGDVLDQQPQHLTAPVTRTTIEVLAPSPGRPYLQDASGQTPTATVAFIDNRGPAGAGWVPVATDPLGPRAAAHTAPNSAPGSAS